VIFGIDRVQYSKSEDKFYVYEFMEIPNLGVFLSPAGTFISDKFWEKLYEMITELEINKIIQLFRLKKEVVKNYIFYQQGIDKYVRIQVVLENATGVVMSFNDLQQWFRDLNNTDDEVQTSSKGLGTVRASNEDNYVNGLLQSLYSNNSFKDDNGLELTKRLLNGDTTKGFDFDLFQYIPSTNEYIIYEFLKRDFPYIDNIQAHPMRYSWTGKTNDNKQKYISLWKAKEYLNARFFLVSYSDNINEKVSIIEVLALDEDTGFVEENKYVMSQNVFHGWLKDMNTYQKDHNDYLSDFKSENYNQEFFEKYQKLKFDNDKKYGEVFKR